MSTIYDVVNARIQKSKWEEDAKQREPFLLEAFFAERKQIGIDIALLKGKKPNVRPLDLSAWDVKVNPIIRGSISKVETEMPFFKNSLNINERQRQELLKVIATGNEQYINAVIDNIYNDNKTLLEDAAVTREVMRAQLLTTGAIAMSSNGQSVSYDFGVPAGNKITLESTAKWDAPSTADPIKDITTWQDQIENATGNRPTILVMNRVTLNLMLACNSVKNAIYVLANGTVTPTEAELKKYVLAQTGCTIYVYNKGYHAQGSNSFTKFVADNVVALFTEGNLGEFVFGTTPEEADLMGGSDADVEIVDLGVALSTYKEKDPVSVSTKVSMVGMPTLEKADELIIATVA